MENKKLSNEAVFSDREKFLLRRSLELPSFHYLRACTHYAGDGHVKAENHLSMAETLTEFLTLRPFENELADIQRLIHDETQLLTDYLDERIGLPLETPLYGNEWDEYVDKFITAIIEMLPDLKKKVDACITEQAAGCGGKEK